MPVAHRYFFALKPDPATARATHVFAETEIGAKGLLEPERHHVTLALTADMADEPPALVQALLRAGEAVGAAPFGLRLDRLVGGYGTVSLRPSRVVPALRRLQAAIATAMAEQRIAMREGWAFSPHETLAYRAAAQSFTRSIEGFHWNVTHFVLVHSMVGLHRHETIGRWPLVAPVDPQGRLF